MKKLLSIMAVGSVLAYSAFAEITYGMYGQGGLNLLEKELTDDSKAYVGITPSFAPNARVGLNVKGTNVTENMGFELDIFYNGVWSLASGSSYAQGNYGSSDTNIDGTGYFEGGINVGDNAKIWGNIGPFGITFGRMCEDDLRASMTFEDWGVVGGVRYIDDMFRRFDIYSGLHVDFTLKGFYAAAAIDAWQGEETPYTASWWGTPSVSAEDVYKGIQVAAAYTIDRVGTVKAQYIGETKAKQLAGQKYTTGYFDMTTYTLKLKANDWEGGFMNVGFSYNGTKNLELEAGSTLFVNELSEDGSIIIAAAAQYTGIPALTLRFGGEWQNLPWDNEDANNIPVTLGLDGKYKVYSVDIGATTKYCLAKNTQEVVLTPFVRKNIGQWFGGITAGVQFDMTFNQIDGADKDTSVVFKIPVGIELGL